jgi:plasmid stabilization system protein ParE
MAFEVELTEEARADYYQIIDWYEKQQSGLGLRFYSLMNELFQKLELHPSHYSFYRKPFRQTTIKGFPYRAVFKIEKDKVRIVAIFHTSRNQKALIKRFK